MRFEKISFTRFVSDFASAAPVGMTAQSLYDALCLPERATKHSAGYDFFAPFPISLAPGEFMTVPTGIRAILDDDKFLAIYPRSGLGFKYRLQLFNTVGIIDADYAQSDNEGHIFVKIMNSSPEGKTVEIKQGEAFCQGIIQQYFLVDGDNASNTRNGGLGSTT